MPCSACARSISRSPASCIASIILKYGLSLVLVVIGVKMLIADIYHVPTWLALVVTGLLIGGSVVVSILRPSEGPVAVGWVPGSPKAKPPKKD